MRLGVDTAFYAALCLEDALERLADLGWKDVQVSAGHLGGDGSLGERPAAVRRTCDALGVTVWQVHCDAELGPGSGDLAANLAWLDTTRALGARCLITHANRDADYNTEDERRRCLDLNRDCLAAVASCANQLGLRVALENRLERLRAACRRFGARMQDFLDLIDAVDADNLGVCLDTSHTRVSRLSFAEEIGRSGRRLLAAQVSDSDGELQHRMPFTLDIDWDEVVSALRGIGYEGLLSLDCGGDGDAPLDALDGKLRTVRERFEALAGGREQE
ncbi:MAG TPA: sugar phosphate isomerase/epimerase [Planctomycetota bacterium]|nr:sugar phosphate isomerase/epimerase [Planctomycetota bacterium]